MLVTFELNLPSCCTDCTQFLVLSSSQLIHRIVSPPSKIIKVWNNIDYNYSTFDLVFYTIYIWQKLNIVALFPQWRGDFITVNMSSFTLFSETVNFSNINQIHVLVSLKSISFLSNWIQKSIIIYSNSCLSSILIIFYVNRKTS